MSRRGDKRRARWQSAGWTSGPDAPGALFVVLDFVCEGTSDQPHTSTWVERFQRSTHPDVFDPENPIEMEGRGRGWVPALIKDPAGDYVELQCPRENCYRGVIPVQVSWLAARLEAMAGTEPYAQRVERVVL
jgi:hypothetical protein